MHERTIKSRKIYSGRIIKFREDKVLLSNGVVSHREIVEHPGAVAILAVTKDKKMILIRQFRKSAERVLFEIPAGLVHKGEDPARAAGRELIEESGYKAKKIKQLFYGYSSPGYSTEIIRFYLASDLVKVGQNYDHDEMIEVDIFPIKKCLEMVKKGKIHDNKTILAILYLNLCGTK